MSRPPGISLPPQIVEEIFPFLLVLDSQLQVVHFGRALPKVCKNVAIGVPLPELFVINRPRVQVNMDALRRATRNTFFLESLTTKIGMRCQVLYNEEINCILFVGSPWFNDMAELEKSGLVLKDFTIQDPIVDFLYMMQARTVALEDARRFGQEAAKRRDELEVINKRLDEASRTKSQFLANTSHELRTPLNGIIGMGTLLSQQQLSAPSRHYCDTILKSARTLLHVVNDILDISKIEAGKMALEKAPFSLPQLIDQLTDTLAVTAHGKGIELLCLVDSDVPTTLCGDVARLRQVFENLLSNAVKFTSQGEVVLRVKLLEREGKLVRLRVSVSDTGIGIAAADQARLFQAFSQVDGSTTRRFGGTGLGLALCKQLVNLMGGDIGVDSVPDKGSTFYFTVNLELSAEGLGSGPDPNRLAHVHVLVVDDNSTNREFLSTLLTQWGATVETAADALEAMQKLRQAPHRSQPFDLAIVDQHMPGMTGLDLVSVLAANPSFLALQVIVLSSVDTESVSAHPLAQRVQAVLSKPVRPSMLLDCLSRLFKPFAQVPSSPSIPVGAQPAAASPTALPPGQPADILTVDDNPINLDVVVRLLESLGYRADVANHGQEALEALERHPYRLVFMDLQMPTLDGYQATAAIRQREGSTKRTPIVAMTAHAMAEDRRRALNSGFSDYIAKPLDLDQLAQILSRWLPQSVPAAASASAPEGAPGEGDRPGSPPPAPASQAPSILEPRALENLRRFRRPNEPDLVEQIGRKYLAALPEFLIRFREAQRLSDLQELKRCAHKLKSSSALLGATRLAELCGTIETQAESGQLEPAMELVHVLLEECSRVEQAIYAEISAASAQTS